VSRSSLSKRTRFAVFNRDGFTCQYCGRRPPLVVLQCDHIVPVAKGGTNDHWNLTTACTECNLGKSDGFLLEHDSFLRQVNEPYVEFDHDREVW
jgi:5-methylcytosine-specific restriction endonuclease McrA